MAETLDEITEWYIPGPVDVRQETLDIMAAQPYGHRTDEIKPFVEGIRRDLFTLVNAHEETHSMVLMGGSGTSALEMAARSWARPNEHEPKVLVPSIGLFGDLWADIFKSCGVATEYSRSEDGGVVDADELQTFLSGSQFEIVAVTHNDTSTGTVNPLADIARIVKASGALLFVDAVSSVGGMDIDVSGRGIDFLAMAPQKSLGVPPGLSLAVVSNEALTKVTAAHRGFATDVLRQVEANKGNMTLTTPPEAQIGALALQMRHIIDVEGPANRYSRHKQLADMAREWAESEEFPLLPDTLNASNTVSCFVNTREIDLEALRQKLWANRPIQYGFDSGHPKLAKIRRQTGKLETFRIPHMGDRQPEQLEMYLGTLSSHLLMGS